MGDWYVIASIPTWHRAGRAQRRRVISTRRADGTIDTTFTFRQGGFDGRASATRRAASCANARERRLGHALRLADQGRLPHRLARPRLHADRGRPRGSATTCGSWRARPRSRSPTTRRWPRSSPRRATTSRSSCRVPQRWEDAPWTPRAACRRAAPLGGQRRGRGPTATEARRARHRLAARAALRRAARSVALACSGPGRARRPSPSRPRSSWCACSRSPPSTTATSRTAHSSTSRAAQFAVRGARRLRRAARAAVVGGAPPPPPRARRPARTTPLPACSTGSCGATAAGSSRARTSPPASSACSDLARYPELRWLDRYDAAVPVALGSHCRSVRGSSARRRSARPLAALVWGFCISTVAALARDLHDQLARAPLRLAPLRDERRLAQQRLARAADVRRGLAQQPSPLPGRGAPGLLLVGGRPQLVRAAAAGGARHRPRPRARAAASACSSGASRGGAMKIAVVGAGIAGNVAARGCIAAHDVTVFEAAPHVGGHTHTHDVEIAGRRSPWTPASSSSTSAPIRASSRCSPSSASRRRTASMSFSVRDEATGLEYNGTLAQHAVRAAAQPAAALVPRHGARHPALQPRGAAPARRAGRRAAARRLPRARALRPRISSITTSCRWARRSGPPTRPRCSTSRRGSSLRFLHNHGMLTVDDRPVWRMITGGSARYVETPRRAVPRTASTSRRRWSRCAALPGGVLVKPRGQEAARFDAVVPRLPQRPGARDCSPIQPAEREVLGAIPYQRNEAVLHTDARLLPRRRRAWAAWNYHVRADSGPVALTYNMNILQRLDAPTPLLVTLNRTDAIDPDRILERITLPPPAVHAGIGGGAGTPSRDRRCARAPTTAAPGWRNGFHEDGVASALAAVGHFRGRPCTARSTTGRLSHRRARPVPHAFDYALCSCCGSTSPNSTTCSAGAGCGPTRRPALAWLRRADYLGDPAVPLDDAVRDRVEARLAAVPTGPSGCSRTCALAGTASTR